jgi:hypothetical protein
MIVAVTETLTGQTHEAWDWQKTWIVSQAAYVRCSALNVILASWDAICASSLKGSKLF